MKRAVERRRFLWQKNNDPINFKKIFAKTENLTQRISYSGRGG